MSNNKSNQPAYTPSAEVIAHLQSIRDNKTEFISLVWEMCEAYLFIFNHEGAPTEKKIAEIRTNFHVLREIVLNS